MTALDAVAPSRPAKRTIVGGAIGNLIEGYDWNVYGLMAVFFSAQIFPSNDPVVALIQALVAFAIGFFVRPLGALVFSPIADRRGRRFVLMLSIAMIGVGALILGLTPASSTIGVAAPLLFLLARVIQGLSYGSEWQTAITYLGEQVVEGKGRRGVITSVQVVSAAVGILVASGVTTLTQAIVGEEQMAAWGWRIPFLIGAAMCLFSVYIRYGLPETPAFEEAQRKQNLAQNPLLLTLRRHKRQVLEVFAIEAVALPFYLWLVFLPTLAHLIGDLPPQKTFVVSFVALAFYIVLLPFMAYVSDRWLGRRPMMLIGTGGWIVLAIPLFLLLRAGTLPAFIVVAFTGCFLLAVMASIQPALMCELFPTEVRTTGNGIGYALSVALFGGTAPFIATSLVSKGLELGIAIYIMILFVAAGIVYLRLPETRHRRLDQPTTEPTSESTTEPAGGNECR